MKIWREGGKIKKNSSGIVVCDDCPCGSCPGCSGMLHDFYMVKLPAVTSLGSWGCNNLCYNFLDEAEIEMPYLNTTGTIGVNVSCNFYDQISGGCPDDIPTLTWVLDLSLGISRSWVGGFYAIAFQMNGSVNGGFGSIHINKTWRLEQATPFNCNFSDFAVPRIGGLVNWCNLGASDDEPVLVSV